MIVRLDRLQTLTDEWVKCQHGAIEQMDFAVTLHRKILAAEMAVEPIK